MFTPSSVFDKIAQEVGVTPRTVRRVLASELRDTRPSIVQRAERIRSMAKSLGYRPHAAARATRSGRFDAVALLVGSVTQRYLPSEMVYGAENRLDQAGMHMMFARLPDEQVLAAGRVPRVLEEWSVDGLLIHYPHGFPAKMPRLIAQYRVPSIWINTRLAADCAYLDDLGAAEAATIRLLGLGHRRIAYVNFGAYGHYSEADRRDGYCRAMRVAGLTPRVVETPAWSGPGKPSADRRLEAASQLLAGRDRPTAVLCYETSIAGPVVQAAALAGLRLPRDLSVIKFGRLVQNDTGIAVDTICTGLQQAGEAAVEMLQRKINEPAKNLPPRVLSMPYEPGATLAPAPQ